MGALMRAIDWSSTPIGPVESWSDTLRMTVRLILANPSQMLLWWGPQFCQIYNDASWPALGVRHPRSMGQPAHECWPEIWHIIGPFIKTSFKGGEPTWMDDIFLEVNRAGFTEETHWTMACGPVLDEGAPSGIGGVIGCVNEVTEKVVGERRMLLLRDLGARSSEANTAEEACGIAAETFGQHDADVPFALLYLVSGDRRRADLAGFAGISLDQASMWGDLPLDETAGPWPLAEALRCESIQVVEPLARVLPSVPPGPWTDPPRTAVVCPVASNMAHQFAGLLVMGVSSRLQFDDRYRGFCDLVTNLVATAIANARAYEEERKRAGAQWENERQFRLLAESIPHHVWSFVPSGAVEYCNQRLLDYTGLTREQVAADGIWGSLHPADADAVRTAWRDAIATESGFEVEHRLRGRDGIYRRFVSRGVAVTGKEGHPLTWFATSTDVEDRRRTKEALDETRSELARVARVTTMGNLAASIAHEVIQPLTAISTNASAGQRWLAPDARDLKEVGRALERIARDATRAGEVVTRIRKFLKREAVQRAPLDIHELLVEVITMVRGEIESASVTLVAVDADPLPLVQGDRVQLQQVLLNLVLNAIDAMRSVSGRTRVLEVGARRHGVTEVEVRVRDSGVGLDVSRRDRVFEPFHTTKVDGMGLGLVISRSIVEAHGGHLRVTANNDYGETFHFTLPLVTANA